MFDICNIKFLIFKKDFLLIDKPCFFILLGEHKNCFYFCTQKLFSNIYNFEYNNQKIEFG